MILAGIRKPFARFFDPTYRRVPQIVWFVPLLSLTFFLFFGLSHLSQFETADENLWYRYDKGRIAKYWNALTEKRWADTRINDKPGVTTALIAGSLGWTYDHNDFYTYRDGKIDDRPAPGRYEERIYLYRLPILLVNALLILLIVFFTWKFSQNPILTALFSIFLFSSPILLGISQIVNPDATVWSFGFASLMAYLVFIRTGKFRYLFVAGPLLGLALLSKYSPSFIYFVAFGATFALPFFEVQTFSDRKEFFWHMTKTLIGFPLLVAISLVVFATLMPAAWLDHSLLYKGTIGFRRSQNISDILMMMKAWYGIMLLDNIFLQSQIFYFLSTKLTFLRRILTPLTALALLSLLGVVWYNWSIGNNILHLPTNIPYNAGASRDFRHLSDSQQLFFEVKPLVFTQPLFILAGAALALLWGSFSVRRRLLFFLIFLFSLFILAYYYAILQQNILVHVRYSILLYPAITLLAAIGGTFLLETFKKKYLLYGGIALFSLGAFSTLAHARPFYFNYTNESLPRNDNVVGSWGYGGYEAAQFLNALPNSDRTVPIVWSDYFGFCPFYEERCVLGSALKWHRGRFTTIDYVVITQRGIERNQRYWKELSESGLLETSPLWSIKIDNRPDNSITIYKIRHPQNQNPNKEDSSIEDISSSDDEDDSTASDTE